MSQHFEDFMAALVPDFAHESDLAVAVSGGPDSMALAHRLSSWAAAQKNKPHIHVLCVDHGLRPESVQEAQTVLQRVSALPQARAEVLTWTHEGIDARIQEEARAARYGLMAEYCRTHKIAYLFLAHHRDDQAETMLFRLAKGSGLDGLAGMQILQKYDEHLTLVRPFLALPKSELLEYCAAHAIEYITDPSNDSDRFARVRMRKSFLVLEAEGLSAARLSTTANRLARAKYALDFIAESLYKEALLELNTKQIVFNFEKLKKHPEELLIRCVLRGMDFLVPFKDYRPRLEKIEDICSDLLESAPFRKRTLGGVVFERDDGGACLLLTIEHEKA